VKAGKLRIGNCIWIFKKSEYNRFSLTLEDFLPDSSFPPEENETKALMKSEKEYFAYKHKTK
jgi:hypothetical protein